MESIRIELKDCLTQYNYAMLHFHKALQMFEKLSEQDKDDYLKALGKLEPHETRLGKIAEQEYQLWSIHNEDIINDIPTLS